MRQSKHERQRIHSSNDSLALQYLRANVRDHSSQRSSALAVNSPLRDSRKLLFWMAYACTWLALGTWFGLNVIIGHRNSGQPIAAWEPLTWELSSVAVLGVLAVFAYHFERRFPLSGADWPRRLAIHVPAAIVFSAIHVVVMVGIRKLIYLAHEQNYDFGDPWLGFAYELPRAGGPCWGSENIIVSNRYVP